MFNKRLSLLLAVVMLLSMTLTLGTATAEEPVEITVILQLNPEIVLDDNPMVAAIEEKLNIKLNIEAPPQDGFWDRVKMLVATGDMPDLVHYGADIFATQWAEEGLLLDVTDLIPNYPHLDANLTDEQLGDCVFLPDGRVYGIPRANSYDQFGFIINKKWLDAVGMEVPKTVAQFVEVCRAFTFNDPDGNGLDDTFGVSLNAQQASMDSGIWHLHNDFFSMAYSISSWHFGMPDADGSAKLRALKSTYPDYMKQLHEMYAEGIIDREFITHNAEENYEKIGQNRVGIVGASAKNYTTAVLEKYYMNPDDYIYCAPLVLNEGDSPVYAMPPSNWMAYYINANSSPEKQDAALRLLDYASSEEGFVLTHLGLAGDHYDSYDIETRSVVRSEEQEKAWRKVTSNMFGFANAYKGMETLQGGSTPEMQAKWAVERNAADAVTLKCYFGFTKMLDEIGVTAPDEVQALNSLEVRYITGAVPFEELQAYITDKYAPVTAEIAQVFADYMAEHPARFEK